jgi:hypothetical protein
MIQHTDSPIQLTKHPDGIWQLDYYGRPTGFIGRIKIKTRDKNAWRAVSVHGHVHHARTLESARQWLLSSYQFY